MTRTLVERPAVARTRVPDLPAFNAAESPYQRLRQAADAESCDLGAWVRLAGFVGDSAGLEFGAAILDEAEANRDADADPTLLVARADLYLRRGFDDAGERVLQLASDRFPDDQTVLERMIQQDIASGRFADARERIGRLSLSTRTQRVRQQRLAALLSERTWNVEDAAAACEEAIRIAPTRVQGRRSLARIDVLRMRADSAHRGLQEICALNRTSSDPSGKSTNASQSLVGEFVNELRSDPNALGACQVAYESRDVGMAYDIVQNTPGYTGAGKTLLLLLRKSGDLETKPAVGAVRAIPRRIVQFWDEAEPPRDVVDLMGSWVNHNPGWRYTRHSSETARRYLASSSDLLLRRAWLAARSVAQRADLFRLAVLAREGGVYADADDRCTGPLEGLTQTSSLLVWQERYGTIGNNFIACRPGHPVIEMALEQAIGAILRGDGESIWFSTGPGLLTRSVASYLAEAPGRADNTLRIVEQHELKTVCRSGCLAAYKAAGRHWMNAEFNRPAARV